MSFSYIIGQPLAVELAQQWYRKGSTHPLLFYGPEGVGKRTLALELAKALECRTEHPGAAVEKSCPICRKASEGHHPDVRVVDLAWQAVERDELVAKQQTLRMDTVMAERKRLLQTAVEGPWKVLILDDAHRLTPDAANVLLKILEEPPPQTAIILLTPFRDRLFSTIVSRCQPVRFRPLGDAEMDACLRQAGMPDDSRTRLIELALGSPGRAMHLNREEQLEALQEAETVWNSLSQKGGLPHGEGRGRTRPGRAEIEPKVLGLLVPAQQAMRQGDETAAASVQLIQDTLQKLRQNVQPALAYDVLLMQLGRQRRQ